MSKKKEIRVLEVNINDIGQGGAWSFIKNAMNVKSDYQIIFDFFTLEPFECEDNIKFIEDTKGQIIVRYTKNKVWRQFKTFLDLKDVLRSEKYDIVHIHSDVAFKLLAEGLAARCAHTPHIILHSHCTGVDRGHRWIKIIAHKICKSFLGFLGTNYLACSQMAGKWMYTKKVNKKLQVINNAIDCKKFTYCEEVRNRYRESLGIRDEELLVGHVGRFMYQKNHEFLIKVFEVLHKDMPVSKLILIGEGELENKIRALVYKLKLDEAVIFVGVSKEVNCYMQAMDLFILPSRFEGLPVVGIEAQAAGLPCLMSDAITVETNLFGLVEFLSLSVSAKEWASKIVEIVKNKKRRNTYNQMIAAGYDISVNNISLKDIYASMICEL